MDNFSFNKYVLKPQKNNSVLEEIQANDIYTVHSPEFCPSLPDVARSLSCQSQLNRSMAPENNVLLNSQIDSLYVVFEEGVVDRQPKLKKLSIGTYQNLPAVMEEDIELDSSIQISDSSTFVERDDAEFSQELRDPICFSGFKEMDEFCSSVEEDYYENYDERDTFVDEESWVDLSRHTSSPPVVVSPQTTPNATSPQTFLNSEEYLRLLREAQRESNQSSARVSLASSRRDSPRDTPRSPPNSPNTELASNNETFPVKEVLINYINAEGDFVRVEKAIESDWLWHWSSRPDQEPPKDWNFTHSKAASGRGASLRKLMVGNSSIFSRDVLYTLILTNVLSLLLGTGIGIWLSKRSGGAVTISTLPLN